MEFREQIAERIIKYRVEKDLNQKELAKILKISNTTLCNIENKKEEVRDITLRKVLKRMERLENAK